MKRRIIPILAMLACFGACTEKTVPEEERTVASFTAEGPSLWAIGTRSILTDPDIETKVTCVTLAAYTGGALDAFGYYTSPYSMVLSLVPGRRPARQQTLLLQGQKERKVSPWLKRELLLPRKRKVFPSRI